MAGRPPNGRVARSVDRGAGLPCVRAASEVAVERTVGGRGRSGWSRARGLRNARLGPLGELGCRN